MSARIDTGSSITFITKEDEIILNKIIEDKECEDQNGLYLCKCTGENDFTYPEIEITLGGTKFDMERHNYILYKGTTRGCLIMMKVLEGSTSWIIGN